MSPRIVILFATIVVSSFSAIPAFSQPYWGTIFIDPDIILPTDPSAIVSTTYTGQGNRVVWDRRVPGWVTINAFLFDIVWDDGITCEAQINPEFGTIEDATIEAEKYAFVVGQLPTCLREDVNALWIHMGVEAFGGGNNSILIHTGQTALYEEDGILEETLIHESTHTSLDATHAASSGWLAAQSADPEFISQYAEDNPTTEDVSESYLTWIMVRHRSDRISLQDYNSITEAIPNRLAYFDEMECDLYPIPEAVSVTPILAATTTLSCSPNPASDNFTIHYSLEKNNPVTLEVRDMLGKKVSSISNAPSTPGNHSFRIDGRDDTGVALPSGVYFVVLRSGEQAPVSCRLILAR